MDAMLRQTFLYGQKQKPGERTPFLAFMFSH